MTSKIRLLLPLIVMLAAFAVYAQTADDIILKSVAARGYLQDFYKISDMKFEIISKETDKVVNADLYIKLPDKIKLVSKAANMHTVAVVNKDSVWLIINDSIADLNDLAKQNLKTRLATQARVFYFDYWNYRLQGASAKFAGTETKDSIDYYKIEFIYPPNQKIDILIDTKTYLETYFITHFQNNSFSAIFEVVRKSYKELNGIKFPFYSEANMGTMSFEVLNLEINSGLDDSLFDINQSKE